MFNAQNPSNKQSMLVKVDFRIVSIVLVVALATSVFLWKPWTSSDPTRKITISGSATIKATPDEYQLMPYFEFTGDRTKTTNDAATMASGVTANLKELGVKDEQISSNTNSYDKFTVSGTDSGEDTLTLSYTITLTDKAIAQKVQDYFLNTAAKGQLSPQASFSEDTQKKLEAEARQKAIDDAKSKASKSAGQVDAKLGKVLAITDDASGGVMPYAISSSAGVEDMSIKSSASIPVQSGQNEFTSTVKVEFQLR